MRNISYAVFHLNQYCLLKGAIGILSPQAGTSDFLSNSSACLIVKQIFSAVPQIAGFNTVSIHEKIKKRFDVFIRAKQPIRRFVAQLERRQRRAVKVLKPVDFLPPHQEAAIPRFHAVNATAESLFRLERMTPIAIALAGER